MGLTESFRVLGMARAPGAAPALSQVLFQGDERLTLMAADALLASPVPRGCRALVTGFPKLPKSAQDLVASRIYRLKDELRSAVVSNDPARRNGALELMLSSTSSDILPLVAHYLGDPNAQMRAKAMEAYVAAAMRLAEELGDFMARVPSGTPLELAQPNQIAQQFVERLSSARQSMITALAELRVHRDMRVVDAAIELGEGVYDVLGEVIRKGGEAEDGNRMMILRHLLADESLSTSRFLFWMLGQRQPMLRKQGARVLASREPGFSASSLSAVLSDIDPDHIRKLVRLNKGLPWMLPLEGHMAGVPLHAFVVMERELEKVHIELGDRAVWLRILADCPEPGVSSRAVAALLRMREEHARDQFIQLTASRNDDVALAAIEYLGRTRHEGLARAVAPRINSENAHLAAVSRRVVARRSFERIIDKWEVLAHETRMSAASTIMALDPDSAMLLLPEFNHSEGVRRARAAHIAASLGLARRLRIHIVRLIDDPSPRARATAISAMGLFGDPAYFDQHRRLLSDVDQRVRSNLIEAIGRGRNASYRDWIEPFLQAPILRQRVNAAVALIRMGFEADGMALLEAYLGDADAKVRAAAAFGIGESGLSQWRNFVVDALRNETDERVRELLVQAEAKLAPREGGK